ncbi:MAG: hypothetical protein K9N35_10770 [Candidatus Marinimicrobia bacterium]|nr:hypothetical protein [Candidatus Neomarinimicrobiota bacterium]
MKTAIKNIASSALLSAFGRMSTFMIVVLLVMLTATTSVKAQGLAKAIMSLDTKMTEAMPINTFDRSTAFHLYGGVAYGKIRNSETFQNLTGIKPASSGRMLVETFIWAVAFEVLEYKTEANFSAKKYDEIYGSRDTAISNNAADILAAALGSVSISFTF